MARIFLFKHEGHEGSTKGIILLSTRISFRHFIIGSGEDGEVLLEKGLVAINEKARSVNTRM